MDRETRKEWELSLGDDEDFPTYKTLTALRIRALASAQSEDQSSRLMQPTGNETKPGKASAHVATGGRNPPRVNSTKVCLLCNGNHFLSAC